MFKRALTMAVAIIAIIGCGQQPADDAANFVMTNGKIYTVNEAHPWAEAVAVKGKEIVYVGDNAGAAAFVGKGTEEIDLAGRLMLPGFVESHIHLGMGAGTTSGVIMEATDSLEEVLDKVRVYAEANPDKKTIFGASYSAFIFDATGPTKELLDEIVPDRAVYLMDHTLHAAWVNSKAYEVVGITVDTPNPPGGEYVKNAGGELSGWVKGGPAHLPILVGTNAITQEGIMSSLPNLLEGLSEYGFTTVIDMGAPFATEAIFDAYVGLDNAGELPLRVSATHYINNEKMAEDAAEVLAANAERWRSEHVWFDTLKITIDSVIENQKARMLEPFLTTGDPGDLYLGPEAMKKVVLETAAKGFGVTVHTIGDGAVRAALDAAQALREAGYTDTRYSTTHSQMVDPADRPRYKELDVHVQTTGNWAVFLPAYVDLIGMERTTTLQFPFRSWADDGVTIALGSDWPATPGGFDDGVHAFNNIYTSMHRSAPPGKAAVLGTEEGKVLGPTDQVLTLAEAVKAYTLGGARMLGIEDQVGSIEVGKKADLIVLDQNLFEIEAVAIPNTKVLGTMFDGRIVHDMLYGLGDSDLVDLDDYDAEITGMCGHTTHKHK